MNQPSVAQADQLQRKSDELDARGAYLEVRDKLAEQTEAAITKGQYELSLLDATILARETIVNEQQDRMLALDKEYARKQTILEHAILKKQELYAKWELKLAEIQVIASNVKASIAERQDYYKQQEALISKQADEGNLQLRGLEYELIEIKQSIKDLETTKRNLYSEQKTIESDLQDARDSFIPELQQHEADVLIAQTRISELDKEIRALLIKRQQIH